MHAGAGVITATHSAMFRGSNDFLITDAVAYSSDNDEESKVDGVVTASVVNFGTRK